MYYSNNPDLAELTEAIKGLQMKKFFLKCGAFTLLCRVNYTK